MAGAVNAVKICGFIGNAQVGGRAFVYWVVNMPQILFREIRTRGVRPDFGAIRQEWERALDNEIKPLLIQEFNKCVATWREHKLTFQGRKRVTSTEIKIYVYPVGSAEAKRIYGFVTGGTSHRWAVMSQDWQSKTTPKIIGSTGGSGRVILRGERVMKAFGYTSPMPGLEAREFEETITKAVTPVFRRSMEAAAKRGIRKAQRG